MKKISIIIVTYNSEKHIYDCLDSVFKYNDIGEELEVINVDNCSNGFEVMVQRIKGQYGETVRIVKNTHNGGYGQGNNVGIRLSIAPIIMIMNPDVRLCEPVFSMVWNEFEHDRNIVMYGLTQRQEDGTIGLSTAWTSRLYPYIAEPMRYMCGKLNIYWQKYMYVSGACFFVRKSAFEEAGLFDENIFMYNEEDDIHGRLLKQKDARIIYDRKHSYLHLHPTVSDYTKESHSWLKRNLDSLIYMNERDGISREKTIRWSIKRTCISVWSEKLKILLGRGDKNRLNYYSEWRVYLRKIL